MAGRGQQLLAGGRRGTDGPLQQLDLVYTTGDRLDLAMPITDFTIERTQATLGVRFFGALSAIRAAVPKLKRRRFDHVDLGTPG